MAEPDISLNFDCPRCGAAPHEKCELNTGAPRFASHVERWDIAKDYDRGRKTKPALVPSVRKTRKG